MSRRPSLQVESNVKITITQPPSEESLLNSINENFVSQELQKHGNRDETVDFLN